MNAISLLVLALATAHCTLDTASSDEGDASVVTLDRRYAEAGDLTVDFGTCFVEKINKRFVNILHDQESQIVATKSSCGCSAAKMTGASYGFSQLEIALKKADLGPFRAEIIVYFDDNSSTSIKIEGKLEKAIETRPPCLKIQPGKEFLLEIDASKLALSKPVVSFGDPRFEIVKQSVTNGVCQVALRASGELSDADIGFLSGIDLTVTEELNSYSSIVPCCRTSRLLVMPSRIIVDEKKRGRFLITSLDSFSTTGRCKISRVDKPDNETICQLVSRKDKSAVYSFRLGQDELDSESRLNVNVEIEVVTDDITQWLSVGEISLCK
ncbi:hypothetical protein SH449x_003154 [Pirellulaceae bacterium SH449]